MSMDLFSASILITRSLLIVLLIYSGLIGENV